MLVMANDFTGWIKEELKERGWSMNELARRAGLSSAHMSNVLNEKQKPGIDFCLGVANAFGEPEEEVIRMAGLISPLPHPEDMTLQEIYEAAKHITKEERIMVLKMIKGLRK